MRARQSHDWLSPAPARISEAEALWPLTRTASGAGVSAWPRPSTTRCITVGLPASAAASPARPATCKSQRWMSDHSRCASCMLVSRETGGFTGVKHAIETHTVLRESGDHKRQR